MIDGKGRTLESADGTPIWVISGGEGQPLLLVHGGMTSSTRWQPLWPFLTVHYTVSAMDRRGRGHSGDHGPYTLMGLSGVVAEALTESSSRRRDDH